MNNEANRRNTVQRQVVLEEVVRHGCHPTADEVYSAVRKRLPGISLSTVYRNLAVLAEQGEVFPVYGPWNELHYDHNSGDHCHIRCTVCGRVCDVGIRPFDARSVLPGAASGFNIDKVHITFTGTCPECIGEREER